MNIKEVPTLQEVQKATSPKDDAVLPIHEIAQKIEEPGQRYRIGFTQFEESMKGGLKDGDLVIISGVSGEGKTTFAQTLTFHLTQKKHSLPVVQL